ncbi:hypothetical protein LTS10_010476 [Elasticomyces elasticus]|nr:hypothetical protein LTS10_010476 [Elasticomyces elasticus]
MPATEPTDGFLLCRGCVSQIRVENGVNAKVSATTLLDTASTSTFVTRDGVDSGVELHDVREMVEACAAMGATMLPAAETAEEDGGNVYHGILNVEKDDSDWQIGQQAFPRATDDRQSRTTALRFALCAVG